MIVKVHPAVLRAKVTNRLEHRLRNINDKMNLMGKQEAFISKSLDNYKGTDVNEFGELLLKQINLRCSYQKVLHKFFDLQLKISRLKR